MIRKILCLSLLFLLLLAGCGPRGEDTPPEESSLANQISPLTLSDQEQALLNLVGGSDAEYGLYQCTADVEITSYTIEVLSWEDGSWDVLTKGGLSRSTSDDLRLGIVLSEDHITVNFQDGAAQYSYSPQMDGVDRTLETGRSWVWMDTAQPVVPGEQVPLYLEVYDSGSGIRSASLPDTFSDAGQLNSYARAYAVALTANSGQ